MEISVNLKNPAQFFAACGLVVLQGGESRFDVEEHELQPLYRARFVLPDFDVRTLLGDPKAMNCVEQTDGDVAYRYDEYNRPLRLALAAKTIDLDWWLNEFWSDKSDLKTWGGTSTPLSMMHRLVEMIDVESPDVLNTSVDTTASNRPSFGFDPRVTKDTGVAGRLAKIKLYPVTEILCAIGLQYFRPVCENDVITYSVWRDELSPELAMIAGELEGIRALTLSSQREKRSKGIFNFTAAEFVSNVGRLQATKRFATSRRRRGGGPEVEKLAKYRAVALSL